MNREGDSPDYEDLSSEINTLNSVISDLERDNLQIKLKANELIRCVLKHHKNIAIPEQEDLYMALHDLKNNL